MLLFTIQTENTPGREQADVLDNYLFRIAEGDREALARLYEATYSAVYGFALSILKNVPDAEDTLQEVFVQIWNAAGIYTSVGKPLAWIFTITRNLALMCLRQNSRSFPVSPEEWQNHFKDCTQTSTDDRLLLASLLGTLPDAERQIVMLHALSGLKHREIASILKLPLPTVLSKYRRALIKLESTLKKAEDCP